MDRRNTKQRQIVLNAVKSRCDHPNVEQILEQVHETNPKISMATVYRNLSLLASKGQITAIRLSGADRFDLRTDPHSHLVCESCGNIFDIEIDYDCDLDKKASESGYVIHSHQTLFKGLCKECAKKIN